MAGGEGRTYRPTMLEINPHPTSRETWEELGRRLRVDSVRLAAIGGSGHPTSSMSASDLMAVLLAGHLRYDFDRPHLPGNDHHRVSVLCGDSELAEGSMWEAFAHAGHAGLANLVAIVDVNRLGQSGETMVGWDTAAIGEDDTGTARTGEE